MTLLVDAGVCHCRCYSGLAFLSAYRVPRLDGNTDIDSFYQSGITAFHCVYRIASRKKIEIKAAEHWYVHHQDLLKVGHTPVQWALPIYDRAQEETL
jgi:hypothetical protein